VDSETAMQRAERAKQILSDPLVQEALEALESATLRKLKIAQDDKARLRLVDFLYACDLFKQYFVSHVETGKIAADESRWQKMKEAVGF